MTQQRTRLAQVGAAAGGALLAAGPMLEALARRRRRDDRDDDDDDDEGRGHTLRDLVARRRRQNERDDNDRDDEDDDGRHTLRSNRQSAAADDDGDDNDGASGVTVGSRQGIDLDLNIDRIVQDRIDTVLDGGGDNDDEPNIVVERDGDALTVLTRGIAFAQDSQGIAVETGGISYDSGAAADFES